MICMLGNIVTLNLNFLSVDLMIANLHFLKREEHFDHLCKVYYKEAD